ncbi:hypothetical protein [Pseudonocardia eucalypti]|uniref:hypothetical protein n=1 Tax=Pseudonocardia eucalypti TaxID=648755 RepID=UPI001616BC48
MLSPLARRYPDRDLEVIGHRCEYLRRASSRDVHLSRSANGGDQVFGGMRELPRVLVCAAQAVPELAGARRPQPAQHLFDTVVLTAHQVQKVPQLIQAAPKGRVYVAVPAHLDPRR